MPFVNDDHLPIEDGKAIEQQGRHDYNEGSGRVDTDPAGLSDERCIWFDTPSVARGKDR